MPASLIRSYDALVAALDERRRAVGMTLNQLDARAGFHNGYAAHVLALRQSPSSRGLGRMSFECVLGALGLGVVLVELEKVEPAPAARCGHVDKRPRPVVAERHQRAA